MHPWGGGGGGINGQGAVSALGSGRAWPPRPSSPTARFARFLRLKVHRCPLWPLPPGVAWIALIRTRSGPAYILVRGPSLPGCFQAGPTWPSQLRRLLVGACVWGGGGGWHKASVSDCLPLAAPFGLSPLLILTLCGPERVLVVSTEPPDDLSCLTTPGVGCRGDGLLPVPLTRCIQMHTPSPCGGLPTPALT